MSRPHALPLAMLLVASVLAGCGASSRDQALAVVASVPELVGGGVRGAWLLQGSGDTAAAGLERAVVEGYPSLRLISGAQSYSIRLPIDYHLLPNPFFNWLWNISPHAKGRHPVEIAIDFSDGRTLLLAWSDSALQRGAMLAAGRKGGTERVRYFIRGGRENADIWWRESVDLSGLHRRAWGEGDQSPLRVTSIGVEVAGSTAPYQALVSGFLLSR